MKIAITSSDGTLVDRHFGHTEYFYVYELTDKKFSLIEKRKTEKYCENKGQQESIEKIKQTFEVIKDCRIVYTMMIGTFPSEFLKEKGIRARLYSGPVEKIINYYR